MSRLALALAVLLALPAAANAHAVLTKSSPARRAVLVISPPKVELVFNERLEAAYSTASVWTTSNIRIDEGKAVVGPEDPRRLSVALPPLKGGQYVVKYRVLSVDGHLVEGTVPFEIRPRP
ncbi:MAG TPA: copper resistance CopC family protein [Terriglobales bacterium]|nr:copper resistance CopC family protein [Terriglobales bacterium]